MSASSSKRSPPPSDPEPSSKKVRFDARNPSNLAADDPDEDEDAILGIDTIGKSGGAKHSAVNLDGFESDSDDDNFNVRAAERAKAKKRAEKGDGDDDDDMFGDSDGQDDENDPDLAVKKKKTVNFIDERDIEGQIQASTSGSKTFDLKDRNGRVKEEETDSESGGDEGRDYVGSDIDEEVGAGGKKKHAPRIDAFNMQAEGEEGKFDETGNFLRKADPNAVHDSWLEGISKKDMKKAREAEEQRESERRKKTIEQDALLQSELLATLIENLEKGESILEALQRLNRAKPKTKPKWKTKKKTNGDAMDVTATATPEDEAESRRVATVEAITNAADTLLTRGQEHIYEAERELLMRQFLKETGENWADTNQTAKPDQWHFRWIDSRDGGALNGPYDSATIKAWVDAGYFGGNVEFQQVGDDGWVKTLD
jgi:CD2 antigen cytoplasmic tail-binding protein 2